MTDENFNVSGIKTFLFSASYKNQSKRKDYYVNKWLFIIGEILYYFFAFSTILSNIDAFQDPLITCPENVVRCNNPYYDPLIEGSSEQEYFFPDQKIGTPTNWLYPNGVYLSLFFLIIPFIINHYAYNKNKKFWVNKI